MLTLKSLKLQKKTLMLRIYIRISVPGEIQCHKGMLNKYRWKEGQELSLRCGHLIIKMEQTL